MVSTEPTWITVALVAMSTFQTIALAYMASRSRRIRAGDDDRGEHEAP